MPEANQITANSVPDLDEWGPDSYWSCADWITWHRALKARDGQYPANVKFVQEFEKQEFLAAGYDCRTFNSDFRAYAAQEGFLTALYDGIGVLVKPVGWGIDIVENAADAVSSTVEGVTDVAKMLKKLLPILILIVIIGLIAFGYKMFLA